MVGTREFWGYFYVHWCERDGEMSREAGEERAAALTAGR